MTPSVSFEVSVAWRSYYDAGRDHSRSDATNYLGGIADVLEEKGHRTGQLDHLGDLTAVALYDNDRQIEDVRYRWEEAPDPSYTVRLWSLNASD
jgi:hypothetical protein